MARKSSNGPTELTSPSFPIPVSTQNQAFNALLFVYQEVLHTKTGNIDSVRTTRPVRVPTVLAHEEARQVRALMSGTAFPSRS